MINQVASLDGCTRPAEGQALDAVCLVIKCEHYPHCFGECGRLTERKAARKELEDSGHIIGDRWVKCTKCETVNGHGNLPNSGETCPNRFRVPHINHLRP